MPRLDTVGQRINYIRSEQGLTLERLAKQAGLSKSFLWEVEQDRSGISGRRLLQVANALGASLDFLLRGAPAPQNYEPQSIEVPRSLGEFAEEFGLSYRQTMMLLDIERSIVARRGGQTRSIRNKDDWGTLHDAVKDFLEGPE